MAFHITSVTVKHCMVFDISKVNGQTNFKNFKTKIKMKARYTNVEMCTLDRK